MTLGIGRTTPRGARGAKLGPGGEAGASDTVKGRWREAGAETKHQGPLFKGTLQGGRRQ